MCELRETVIDIHRINQEYSYKKLQKYHVKNPVNLYYYCIARSNYVKFMHDHLQELH